MGDQVKAPVVAEAHLVDTYREFSNPRLGAQKNEAPRC